LSQYGVPPVFGAVLLAAGLSTRMGGGDKMLTPWRGRPMIAYATDAVRGANVAKRVAVLGKGAGKVAFAGRIGDGFTLAVKPNPEQGLASSLKLGLRALGTVDGAVIMLADMPQIEANLINALLASWTPDAFAVVPAKDGQWGNPVVLGEAALGLAAGLTGDRGARSLLEARRAEVIELPVETDAIFADIDTPADLDQ
jgi:molybdenum cofactor cytidylyltransferase